MESRPCATHLAAVNQPRVTAVETGVEFRRAPRASALFAPPASASSFASSARHEARPGHVRAPTEGTDPIDIRLFLRLGPSTLTETWLYLWTPPHG